MPGRRSSSANAPWPPPVPPDANEDARTARLRAEAEAKRISDDIDHELSQDKEMLKRRQGIKILLLGRPRY
jgi:guanine nucleotide-binding protein subunit alpha